MEQINKRIMEIKQGINECNKAKRLLNIELARLDKVENEVNALKKQLEKENLDVDKLENISITKFFHMIKGDLEDKLHKETNEAFQAKLKYDAGVIELKDVKIKVDRLKSEANAIRNLEEEYKQCISEKERLLKSYNPQYTEKIDEIINKQVELNSNIKELQEAIYAGRLLLDSLDRVNSQLQSARNWGTYDMLGGGMLSTMAKHNRLDEATSEIAKSQSLLNSFKNELLDVGDSININIEIGSFMRFADYFFDGFFVDWSVQSKINDALDKVQGTINKINSIVYNINNTLKTSELKVKELEIQRNTLIEEA